jgi:heat shock protein HslJ
MNGKTKIMEIRMKKTFLLTTVLFILTAGSSSSPVITCNWELISYGDPANPRPALPNVETSIKFEPNGQISGNVGCNTFGGTYKVNGDKINFSSMMSTMMYCEATSTQEQALLSVLSDGANLQIHLDDNTLTITSADGASEVKLARK